MKSQVDRARFQKESRVEPGRAPSLDRYERSRGLDSGLPTSCSPNVCHYQPLLYLHNFRTHRQLQELQVFFEKNYEFEPVLKGSQNCYQNMNTHVLFSFMKIYMFSTCAHVDISKQNVLTSFLFLDITVKTCIKKTADLEPLN